MKGPGSTSLTHPRRALLLAASTVFASCCVAAHGVSVSRAVISPVWTAFSTGGDFGFGLTFADGTPVGEQDMPGTVIPPGTYQIDVTDSTTEGNFDLGGNGVSFVTGIEQTVQTTWTVTFLPCSLYSYRNDQGAGEGPGGIQWFQTSASASSSAACGPAALVIPRAPALPATPLAPIKVTHTRTAAGTKLSAIGTVIATNAIRGTIHGTIGKTGDPVLTFLGKPVTTLSAGRYELAIVDRAAGRGFLVRKAGARGVTLTSSRFVGERKTALVLSRGSWSASVTGSSPATLRFTVR